MFHQTYYQKQMLNFYGKFAVSQSNAMYRAANLVRPKKGIMMAKKRNFKQKKGIHKNETYNHARHTSNAEMFIHHAVFSTQASNFFGGYFGAIGISFFFRIIFSSTMF